MGIETMLEDKQAHERILDCLAARTLGKNHPVWQSTKIGEKICGVTLSGRSMCLSVEARAGAISAFLPHIVATER
jgi:hypothetical protein